ncbi:acid-sensing ion channel 1-like isoform X2 [Asterias amurensis]|uniref:acid-sensing ion channel 1-like isoform X2 n=1 Tax=Asterias amurensis TaxID=7602 RepID=UPI003AB146E2
MREKIIMDGKGSDVNLENEFANSTSLHGIARVANNKRVPVKLVWVSIMLTCLCVCVYQVHDRFSFYLEYTANTAISVEYARDLDFPAVTICNFNRYRQSQVTAEEYKYLKFILTTTAAFNLDLSTEQTVDKPNENDSRKFNFTEFTLRAGFLIGPALLECKWRGKPCYAENFTHVFTPFGSCWTFNSGKDAPILQAHQAGEGNGLEIFIDIEQSEYTETITNNFQAGLKVVIHDQHTPPLVESSLAISPGVHAFVGIRRQQYLNLEKPHGKCDASAKLDRFEKYSLEACAIDCLTEVIVQKCLCRPVGYPGNETECSPFQERNCSIQVTDQFHTGEIRDCECTVPCNHTAFSTGLSTAVIPSLRSVRVLTEVLFSGNRSMQNSPGLNDTIAELVDDLSAFQEKYIKDNMVILSVYYKELNFQFYEQTKAYTLSALVSDIGGQLGLFLGASFITLAEILVYITHKVKWCFASKRESENEETVESEKSNIDSVTHTSVV